MTNRQKNAILKTLETLLKDSETQWTEKKVSHAYTIGFLQGGIKFLIQELNQNSQN
jgi:hypothetical protein